jgi:hypothetical protein
MRKGAAGDSGRVETARRPIADGSSLMPHGSFGEGPGLERYRRSVQRGFRRSQGVLP